MKTLTRPGAVSVVVGVGLSFAVVPAGPAGAAGETHVRCNDVAGLIAAINRANSGGGRITLAPHCTYTLTTRDNADDGLPEITGNVTITGRDTTVRRAPNAAQDFRILHVAPEGRLTVNSLTISGGRLPDFAGGGIWNSGTLKLNRTAVEANRAETSGGIHNVGGQLELAGSTVERNTATLNGGGIHNGRNQLLDRPGRLTMKGGSLLKNRALNDAGGGLENLRSTAHLASVTVKGNTAPRGGGINQFAGTLRLKSTTLSGNIAVTGGGLRNSFSTASLVRSSVTRNTAITAGGGIFNENSSSVTLDAGRVVRNSPDNCSPEGSVPGCTNPTGTGTPQNSASPSKGGKGRK
ncbi:right-handed parallel beta-helix repeat-containing protein [Streptomyces marispadix]|uniref:Right-handed parallel beta-helix repeat-containing protein n=1 Tax=Streptomyces marispadix TaxID=2922868 RepID=A0ABS9SYD7_9ACTN|nr:right-handed parallel beta-helix repeat-containing protein [Streptomyces marispadix]MCH6161294.1 right-handed parallel beta-helix repeat-containing protein [Streptomyces marispadix]